MTYDEIVAEVVRMTARPDKQASIQILVNSAISFCVKEGNFNRDVDELEITVTPTDYLHSLDLADLPRFRKVQYIRPSNRMSYIEHLEPDKIFVNNRQLCDVFYIVGDSIKINSKALTPSFLVGYYRYPPTLGGLVQDFWLIEVSPYMIIYKAASDLYSEVGNSAEASKLLGLFTVSFTSAMRDLKHGVNYG